MDMGKGQLGFMILWFGFYYGEQIIFYSVFGTNSGLKG